MKMDISLHATSHLNLCLHFHSRVQLHELNSPTPQALASQLVREDTFWSDSIRRQQATMAARVLAFYTLCILLCSLHGVATAATSAKKPLHLRYFAHEIPKGANKTLLPAAGTGEGNLSDAGWGSFLVFDNVMEAGNYTDSRVLGSITGTTVVTSNGGTIATGRGSEINLQHIFKEGSEFNGSSLIVVGHILTPAPLAQFECIVLGGTGALRGYSGYGILTAVPDAPVSSLYTVLEWNIFVTHKDYKH